MLVKSYPTLYKRNSKDNIQVWDVSVVEVDGIPFIQTQYGQRGGKIQLNRDPITEGKNLGKKNETTPKGQACLEAKSSWTYKQAREGYVLALDSVDEDLRDGIDPMLAHRYDKYPHKMEFPCYIQPKLDGHRCIAVYQEGKCTLFSRTRNQITGVPHINRAVEELLKDVPGITILDGELYNHDYHNKFEQLTSFIRSETPKEGHEVVQYHLYDIVLPDTYETRFVILHHLSESFENTPLVLVQTKEVNQDEVVEWFDTFVAQGFEGGILRNMTGKYSHKRSYDLQKVKEFEDAEFTIVAVNQGRGKLKGHAIFECVLEDGITQFEAKLKGSQENLKTIFENPEPYIGRALTVQFQGRTKNNIPRFPVGVRIRTDV